MDHKSLKYIFT
jgi:hypothetical protein